MRLLITTQIVDKNDPMLGFFHAWIAEFAKHCESIEVICLKEGGHSLPQNVRVYSLGKEKGQSKIKYLFNFYRHIWSLRHEYDAVFVHMNPEYVVLGGLLWRLWGKRIGLWYAHKSVNFKLRVASIFPHILITSTAEGLRLRSAKIKIVGQGIDTDVFKPKSHLRTETLNILTVGRVTPIKNIDKMIHVMAALRDRNITATLSVVGSPATEIDREYESKLRAIVKDLNLGNSIFFKGSVSSQDLPALYHDADVFLNLSDTGSLDKVLLESVLCGTPAVSTNVSAPDVVGPFFIDAKSPSAELIADTVFRAWGAAIDDLTHHAQKQHALRNLIPRIVSGYGGD